MGNVTKPMVSSFVPERDRDRETDGQTEDRREGERDKERQIDWPLT